ncbi:MAG: QueT transporter family protein [Clostridia bacterium]
MLFITQSAVIAAVYFALSVALQPLSFGPIQFRISEMMALLPILLPSAIPGLTIGCAITNFFFSPFGIYDMLFGTLATFLASICTYALRRHITIAAIPPMLFNALLVPLIWVVDGTNTLFYIAAAEIFASEFIVAGVIGIPFTLLLKKSLVSAHMIDLTRGKFKNTPPYRRISNCDNVDEE